MYYIEHVGYGPLTDDGSVIEFFTAMNALEYLDGCGESANVGTDWRVLPS